MPNVFTALTKAMSQLFDAAVLRLLVKTVAISVLVFITIGIGLYWALIWIVAQLNWASNGYAEAAAATFITIAASWLLFRIVALAVLQFFADEIVAAVEAKHYPQAAATAKPLPLRRDIANSLKGIGRTLLFNALAVPIAALLFFTAIGPALVFLLINAVLLGRELTDMAWLRHCEGDENGNPVSRLERMMLGGVIAGLVMVPFANLLAPVIGAAAGAHLLHGVMIKRAIGEETGA